MTLSPHDFEPEPEDYNPDPDTLCPNCVTDVIAPESFYGWCARCADKRKTALKSQRQQRWAPDGWRKRVSEAAG